MNKEENIRAYMREIICPKCEDKKPCIYQTNGDEGICPKFAESATIKYEDDGEERMKAKLETKNTEAEGAIYDAIRMPIPERIERALALIVEREAIFEARMAGKNGGRTAEDCIKSARWYLEYASDEHDVVNALKQVMIAKYLEGKE